MSTVSWLHLSDLHLRAEKLSQWNADIVLRALLEDVKACIVEDDLAPDLILASGDIAYSGKPAEYALAQSFLDDLLAATGLKKECLFLVPGNHDVDRGKVSRGAQAIGDSLDKQDSVNEVLTDPGDRQLLLARFEGYAAFANDYLRGHLPFDDEHYFYTRTLSLAGRRIALLGLNSAWVSASDQDKAKGLLVGERQIRAALDATAGADLRIALLHHPFDWLRDFDRRACQALLLRECDFVLHGHLHETELTWQQTPDTRAWTIAAGASYETRHSYNSYNLVQLDLEAGQGTVFLRAWSDRQGGFWAKDVLTYRNVSDGQYTFPLRTVATAPPQKPKPKSVPAPLAATAERYLHYLADRYRYLDFRGMGVSDRVPLRLPLLELYVALKARIELPEGETWTRDLRLAGRKVSAEEAEAVGPHLSEPRPILDMLQDHDGLVILGDPGAGKTTFLKYLALRLALGEGPALGLGNRLPVLLPLSAYANALVRRDLPLDRFIDEYYTDLGLSPPLGPLLDQALAQGQALLLLDGLDEVRELAQRHLVIQRVVDFYTFHRRQGNKFLLTSRIVGYREVRAAAEGLAECTLVDFDDEEIALFVEQWTRALERVAQDDAAIAAREAARERDELLAAVERNPGVRRLAANPLLLTILALMKRQGVVLPERRVQLYEQYVETLLKHWNLARGLGRPPTRDLDVVETVRLLAPLAMWMHETSPGVGLVKREAMQRKLVEIYAARSVAEPEQAARQLLIDAHEYAGLLLERGAGQYGFIHLTFQEYLAAVAIAQRGQQEIGPVVDLLADHVGDDNWHEVTLLATGYMGIVQQRDEAAGAALWELIQRAPGKAGQATVLAGEAVVDAWPGGVTPACRERVTQAVMDAMTDDARVAAPLRAAAGRVLARLGDPRPGVGVDPETGLPDIAWCQVAAGPFLMGSDKARDRQAFDDELPQHEVTLPAYLISKYPITNCQFAAFVAAGGYGERRWWTKDGWSCKERQGWTAPRPIGEPFNLPNHPVVNVSWYEAVAFCRWLTERFWILDSRFATDGLTANNPESAIQNPKSAIQNPKWLVRLPTEAEWEKAARGTEGRIYPWGDHSDPNRANYHATGVGATSAVGCFPGGASPYGVADMAGNVWEWTQSLWGKDPGKPEFKYPYDPADGREDLQAGPEVRRVMRGGAWSLNRWNARCAYRYGRVPARYSLNVGFRVVVSLAPSVF